MIIFQRMYHLPLKRVSLCLVLLPLKLYKSISIALWWQVAVVTLRLTSMSFWVRAAGNRSSFSWNHSSSPQQRLCSCTDVRLSACFLWKSFWHNDFFCMCARLKWEERLEGERAFNNQTAQFNFHVKDYWDLNRSLSNPRIPFVADMLPNLTLLSNQTNPPVNK